jgi:N-acetylmuramoyl-L-alanine amidase
MEAQSFELAAVVYHSMCGHFLQEFDRGIKRARFAVLRRTKIPSILTEGGFLSETGDAKRIADPEWRKQYAESICVGIEGYRALVEKKQRPMLVAEYRAQAVGEINVVDLALPPSSLEPSSNPRFIPVMNPAPSPTVSQPPKTPPPAVDSPEEPEP